MDPAHEETFSAADGTPLHARAWRPAGRVAGVVVLVHGLGEHGGRYGALVDALLGRGLAVWSHDHRGHGRSGGKRGVVRRFEDLGADLLDFIARVHGHEPGLPLAVYGHSLGALVAFDALVGPAGEGVAALVASAPPLVLPLEIPAWKRAVAPVVAALLPGLAMDNEIDPAFLSRDSAVVEAYRTDPLVHRRCSARLFLGILAAARRVLGAAGPYPCPVLMVHGTADPICSPEGSRRLHDRLRAPARALLLYEGFRHECHNEVGRERPVAEASDWIAARLS